MSFESQMVKGYPTESDIEDFLSARGIELLTPHNPNYLAEFKQTIWGILNALDWAMALGVYCPSSVTFNVRGGKYLFKETVKTYTPDVSVEPTSNDTTYIWMAADNTIGHAVDGTGWPTAEHIKLAEIDVNEEGIITAIRDLRGETFLQYLKNVTSHAGASAEMLPIFWDKAAPADNDEIRIPFYGRNDVGDKIEYGRITIKLTTVADGTEAATIKISEMVATTATQTLTGKTIDDDNNVVQNLALTAIKTVIGDANKVMLRDATGAPVSDNITGLHLANIGANGGVPFVLMATLVAGSTVVIHNANAPFKYRVIRAWSIATSGDGGTWQVKNGTDAITDAVAVTATDKTVNNAGTIDDAYHEVALNGSLSVVGDGSLADCIVYLECIRVS
jgi:hypothetical protein